MLRNINEFDKLDGIQNNFTELLIKYIRYINCRQRNYVNVKLLLKNTKANVFSSIFIQFKQDLELQFQEQNNKSIKLIETIYNELTQIRVEKPCCCELFGGQNLYTRIYSCIKKYIK